MKLTWRSVAVYRKDRAISNCILSANYLRTLMLGGTDLKSMFMPAVPDVGDPAGIIMPETATNYCRVIEADVSINTNFGSYDSCIKSHCVYELSIESVEYYCPDAGMVRIIQMDDSIPQDVLDLNEYGSVTNSRAEIIGTWDSGIWYWDGATLSWSKIDDSAPYSVTCGDVTGK